jgi:Uma2 family endonuclease
MATLTQSNTPQYEGRHVTREEYLDLPDDGYQYDMIEGVLHMSPSAYFEHGLAASRFNVQAGKFLEHRPIGYIVQEIDVFLPDGGDILRPDVSFILDENKHIIIGHIHGVPDLVCEVLSDSTRERDLGVKADRYLSNGVKEYWILNPGDKSIQVWYNRASAPLSTGASFWEKKSGPELSSELLPGLFITVENIFG